LETINANIFYISIIVLASLLAQLSQMISTDHGHKYGSLLLILAFLFLTLPVAFRFYTGADYNTYVEMYGNIASRGLFDSGAYQMEIGYVVLNYLCFRLFDDYQAVFIVIALLTNYFFFKGIINESKKISLGIAVFAYGFTIYFWDFIIIRNMLGIALIFYGLRFIFERKLVKYFLFVTLAVLFHYSLVIFYPFGILYIEKLKKYRIPLAVMTVLLIPIMPTIINILGTNVSLIWTHFAAYSAYFADIKFTFSKYFLICALPLIPFTIFYKKMNQFNDHISLYLSFYIISIVLLLFATTMPILTRYIYALWTSQIILFSSVLHVFDDVRGSRKRFIVKSVVATSIVTYGLVLIVFFINNNTFFMIPYASILHR